MRVAITGGEGFIGSAVVEKLKEYGHDPVALDLPKYDILGPFLADGLHDCDGVIHLAGVLGTDELFETPERAIEVNVTGTTRVLRCCAEYGLSYVGISMPEVWDNVYQATKKAAFVLAHAWNRHFGVPVSHVRAFNVFGEGQKHYGVQKIVPTFAVRAWQGEPIPIWGDGSQTVDLIYHKDVADVMVQALNCGKREVIHAGTGDSFTVNQVAEMVLAITGSKAGIEYLPMRRGEHPVSIKADGSGWGHLNRVPTFRMSDFERTVVWYKQYAS